MTKEKLRKILKGNEALDIDSIPVEEKKSIHLFMEYGFTMSTFYLFFSKRLFGMGNPWRWKLQGTILSFARCG